MKWLELSKTEYTRVLYTTAWRPYIQQLLDKELSERPQDAGTSLSTSAIPRNPIIRKLGSFLKYVAEFLLLEILRENDVHILYIWCAYIVNLSIQTEPLRMLKFQ